jgi:hypothetical protein
VPFVSDRRVSAGGTVLMRMLIVRGVSHGKASFQIWSAGRSRSVAGRLKRCKTRASPAER